VTDTGEGMESETLRRAVEPFYTTKEIGKGTGLGLSMVHGFAEQSGGRLILRSRRGEGTTAELWLPTAEAPTWPIAAPQSAHPAPAEQLRPLRVLAVDDDALVLMNTAAMLEDLGHTVFEACSGKEALEILQREDSVDLIITDQAMPQMTGTQLAKAIKQEWPNMPILLATGYAEIRPEDDLGLPKLSKPFLQDELAAALARLYPTPDQNDARIAPR
jgi:CheY-like chemotaxis protein